MTNPVAADLPADASSNDVGAIRIWIRIAASRLRSLLARDKTGTVTLTANVASTTITDARIASTSAIVLVPTTANAAAEIGAGTMYVSETGRLHGTAVITHANNAQTDRTYRYVIAGT